jgi:hypothetical protein
VQREAVAVQVDDVDVAGPGGDAFFQDARALVDQGEDAALHHLVVADLARRDAVGAR